MCGPRIGDISPDQSISIGSSFGRDGMKQGGRVGDDVASGGLSSGALLEASGLQLQPRAVYVEKRDSACV